MMGRNYERSASGLIVPRSNGYANRIIVDQMGAGSLTLPSWAKSAKAALMGAGGSGATARYNGGPWSPASAGGGGPLSLAWLNLDEVGRTFSYVLGPGGAGVAGFQGTAGNAGSVSSLVWGTRTITCNPGQGGRVDDQSLTTTLLGGLGGTATGGDLNFKGGDGGGFFQRSTTDFACYPGGGSSGRPWGHGLRGGQAAQNVTLRVEAAPGASWGFSPQTGIPTGNLSADIYRGGPGTLGNSLGQDGLPGRGRGNFTSLGSTTSAQTIIAPPADPWWDLDDIAGWGGGLVYPGIAMDTEAGSGGGGLGGLTTATQYPYSRSHHGGFGGGGGAIVIDNRNNSTAPVNLQGGNGGFGGGGGPIVARIWSGGTGTSGKGGDSYLSVWFN